MLIGPKFVAIAYWHQLGVSGTLWGTLWDTLGHFKMFWGLVFSRKVQFFRIFELLALRIFQQIFPGPSSEVLHTELRKISHLHPQKCYQGLRKLFEPLNTLPN